MKKIVCVFTGIAVLFALLSGCSYNFSFGPDSGKSADRSIKTGESSFDGSGINEIEVSCGVGDITIGKSLTEDVELVYRKEINGSSEIVKEVEEKISVDSETRGDKLILTVTVADNNSQDLWSWLSDKFNNINVSVDLDIKVPENIDFFQVNCGVGDIDISDLNGRFHVESGVGSIKVQNAGFTGKCEFSSDVGNIDLNCDISNAESLIAQAGVGDIEIRLPKDSRFSLDAATDIGKIVGSLIEPNKNNFVSDKLKQDINGGGPKLELTAGTGDIAVNKR